MDIQECIDFIDRHIGNDNLVYIVQNDDHEEREKVTGVARNGLMFREHSVYLEIIEWTKLKKDYHLQAYSDSLSEDEDELVETLELNKLELKNQSIKIKN